MQITPEILQDYFSHKIISTNNEETNVIADVLTAFFGEIGNDSSNVIINDYKALESAENTNNNSLLMHKCNGNIPTEQIDFSFREIIGWFTSIAAENIEKGFPLKYKINVENGVVKKQFEY